MNCLVTGHAGFIGSHLIRMLQAQGHTTIGWDITTGTDVRHRNAMYGIDWIFHLAALADIVPSVERPYDYMATNVGGTVQALEAARACGVTRFVYAASSSCYGDQPPLPTSEAAPIDCRYPYALSKWMGEQAALHWHQVYGLSVNALRLFNVYGPRSRTTGAYGAVMGVFLKQRLAGAPLTIVGDGEQSRDFVHVEDVCRAFIAAAETDDIGNIWNVGSGQPKTVNRLADLIGGERVHIPDRPQEPRFTHADIHRIQRDLDWTPMVRFEDGVADLLTRLDDYADAPLWTPETIATATAPWFMALASHTG